MRKLNSPVHRRTMIAGGACFAMLGKQAMASPMMGHGGAKAVIKSGYTKEHETDGMSEIANIHYGKGIGRAKIFDFDDAAWPAHFMIYELPPGASEGVHTHFLDDRNGEGSFDEYYYIISGQGQMAIDDEIVAVAAGDHVHTPLEVAHGIENTHSSEDLRVFLTFIERVQKPGSGKGY